MPVRIRAGTMFGRESPSPAIASVLVVLLGLSVAVFTFNLTRGVEEQQWAGQFRQNGERYSQRLRDRLAQQTDLLRFLSTLYAIEAAGTDLEMKDDDFQALVDPVFSRPVEDRYGPLRTVAWVRRINPGDLAGYERLRRVELDFEYRVHDRDRDGVEQDAVHDVLDHVCHRDPHARLQGLALETDPDLAAVLEQAERKGVASLSSPTRMFADEDDATSRGVCVALPVYFGGPHEGPRPPAGARVKGFVVGMFSLQGLLQQALALPDQEAFTPSVHLELLEHGKVIAKAGRDAIDGIIAPDFPFEIFDRSWTLRVSPASRQPVTVEEFLAKPSTLLTASICIMVLMFAWITWTMSRRNEIIQQRVSAQTAEARQKTLELERKERELNDANRRLLEMSNTDPLTGILNRRAFEVQLDKERERAQRTGVPYGLLIFDVDSFKDYNDRYGHAAGDEVLRRVSGVINAEARRIDTVARYGGEEFVVLATGTDAVGLLALGERIRGRVQEAAVTHASAPKGVITVSGGGSLSSPALAHDPKLAFEVADRCLYQAKSTGRNRVVMVM
jgi:diguanylate cyclase (GGDEF)-like protein